MFAKCPNLRELKIAGRESREYPLEPLAHLHTLESFNPSRKTLLAMTRLRRLIRPQGYIVDTLLDGGRTLDEIRELRDSLSVDDAHKLQLRELHAYSLEPQPESQPTPQPKPKRTAKKAKARVAVEAKGEPRIEALPCLEQLSVETTPDAEIAPLLTALRELQLDYIQVASLHRCLLLCFAD